jgi:CcmD family protein
MNSLGFLFWAYAIVWAALFIYLIGLGRRQARLLKEIAALREELRKLGGA